MSQELIKKIMSGKINLHNTKSALQKKNIKIENPESVWDEVINQKNDFKKYEPNVDYINMMYSLIYVYNSYVDTENEIKPPILNDAYHWDKSNKVYVINFGSSNGVYLYDKLRYLTGRGSESSNYVNLYQILNPSSFTTRHKVKFFDSIAKSEFSLQYSPEISTEQQDIRVPRTPSRTPGQDLNREEIEKNLKNEYSDIFTIHKNIKNLSKLIKDAKEESEIIKNIMSIKTDIYNNIYQIEVNIVDKKEMKKIYKKYNQLYTLINQIEEWYNTSSAGEGFTKEIEKGLNSRSFKIKEIKGVNILKKYEEEEEYENQGIRSIPNNVMRIWINYNLYIDVKIN